MDGHLDFIDIFTVLQHTTKYQVNFQMKISLREPTIDPTGA
jgi:hypothetical protein